VRRTEYAKRPGHRSAVPELVHARPVSSKFVRSSKPRKETPQAGGPRLNQRYS